MFSFAPLNPFLPFSFFLLILKNLLLFCTKHVSDRFVLFCKKECRLLRVLESRSNTFAYRQRGCSCLQTRAWTLSRMAWTQSVWSMSDCSKEVSQGFYWHQKEGWSICMEVGANHLRIAVATLWCVRLTPVLTPMIQVQKRLKKLWPFA